MLEHASTLPASTQDHAGPNPEAQGHAGPSPEATQDHAGRQTHDPLLDHAGPRGEAMETDAGVPEAERRVQQARNQETRVPVAPSALRLAVVLETLHTRSTLHGYLAHRKLPPPPRATIGPLA